VSQPVGCRWEHGDVSRSLADRSSFAKLKSGLAPPRRLRPHLSRSVQKSCQFEPRRGEESHCAWSAQETLSS
jgi:hypothetical protein